ncbi:MAG: hypothetical protein R3F19_26415 [Verrucomicrobiales bacterium]|nr:hypothetical protein [Verrucomicrobiae bacterium]
MFKRLIYEEWQSMIPIAAFILTAIGFVILTARAFFIKPDQSDHMAHLPLSDDGEGRTK